MSELDWERVSSEYGEDIILFRTRFDPLPYAVAFFALPEPRRTFEVIHAKVDRFD